MAFEALRASRGWLCGCQCLAWLSSTYSLFYIVAYFDQEPPTQTVRDTLIDMCSRLIGKMCLWQQNDIALLVHACFVTLSIW